ncbi:hypothetical protein [Streptomyces sp.]|uniref:hypothetical protein n=1 Tax=Streptomyces sp. TaxID=1931 RepID=UPI002D783560|nr:hypothetical protein [Streptomyces sp.]HET6359310.1 hypothetical protein [Streptomyces sp.]
MGAQKVERVGVGIDAPAVVGGGLHGVGSEAVELALTGDLGEYRQIRIFDGAE